MDGMLSKAFGVRITFFEILEKIREKDSRPLHLLPQHKSNRVHELLQRDSGVTPNRDANRSHAK